MRVIAPIPKQFEDSNGVPYTNGKVTVYLHNSTSLAQIYKEAEGGTLAPNPTILDSHGAWNAFVNGGTAYDYVVQDEHDNVIFSYSNVKAYGDAVTSDGIFPLEFNRNGIAAGSYDPLQGGSVDLNETEVFNITQPNLYADISQSIADGRTPVVSAGASGRVRLYYYTSKDEQGHTITFTCGHDGIVELLILHDDNTYEFVDISGKISVLKGSSDNNSITPQPEGEAPEDWDCYEVEKEGDDIWIGDDNRVHANAGWYHVDMGVYITVGSQEEDARTAILFGAYTGTAPDNQFNYTDYCAVDFDLSFEHIITPSVGFDIHVENDGDIIHLSASAPDVHTAMCYLDWFSIHRIKGAGSGGGGGESQGGGDAVVFRLEDYAADYLTGDTLWRDLMSAMLDDKAVGLIAPVEDAINAIGWLNINYEIPDGYTKEQFIDELAGEIPELNNLEFEFEVPLYGGALTMREAFAITPTGLMLHYIAFVVAGFGLILEGNAHELTSESVMPISTQGGFGIDYSKTGECVAALMAKGIPACYTGYNTTNELLVNMGTITKLSTDVLPEPPRTKGFWMEVVGAATWEGNDPNHGIRFPITYEAMFYWTPPDPGILNDRGSWSIDSEEVFPLALDSRFVPTTSTP